ncbi:MFS transporter [Streptomyces corynorhini]|uniref:MFS transporter n=1 Tax=Streptomyces corynorhini TaxID=2282652 RepID=UPI00131471C2|nr:MFS transporter [Streptomyces corynorhini]
MTKTTATDRRRRPLVALLTAQYLSAFGNAITIVTVPLYVLHTTGSTTTTGLAGFLGALPLIFAGAVGGVLVDRFGGRRLSVLSDLSAGVLVVLIPLLDATTGLPIPLLFALLFTRTVVATPATAARMTLLKPVIEDAGARLESVNSWYQAAPRLGLVVGAPLAGLLIAASGSAVGMYVDAATFLVAAALVAFAVPVAEPRKRGGGAAAGPGFFGQLREGMALVRTMPVIGAMTAFVVVTNFLDDAFTPLFLPVYAQEVLDSSAALGWFLGAVGVGAIVGTLLYGPASRTFLSNRRYTLFGCFAVVAVLRMMLYFEPGAIGVTVICFLVGVAGGPLNPMLSTVMLERVPEELRGRVFGLTGAMALTSAPLGVLSAGLLVDLAGLRVPMLCFSLVYLVLIAVSWRWPSLRAMDERPGADDGRDQPAVPEQGPATAPDTDPETRSGEGAGVR